MMTDFRALCAELTAWAEKTSAHYFQPPDVLLRARAALADEPAVPQGREPASVTGQPSDEELLKLAQQYSVVYLLSDGSACHPFQEGYDMRNDVLNFARAVLARWGHQPAPPAEGEVAEVAAWLRAYRDEEFGPLSDDPDARWITRAADLLQRQVLVPVPVSERPWEREEWCDTNGLCWLGSDALDGCTPTWLYGPPAWAERFPNVHRVLLPAHALPLPEVDQMTWQPIDTAPRDGTEILASDYDAIEIVSWVGPMLDVRITGEWTNREGEAMYPAWWQPLPDHLPLPEVGE